MGWRDGGEEGNEGWRGGRVVLHMQTSPPSLSPFHHPLHFLKQHSHVELPHTGIQQQYPTKEYEEALIRDNHVEKGKDCEGVREDAEGKGGGGEQGSHGDDDDHHHQYQPYGRLAQGHRREDHMGKTPFSHFLTSFEGGALENVNVPFGLLDAAGSGSGDGNREEGERERGRGGEGESFSNPWREFVLNRESALPNPIV